MIREQINVLINLAASDNFVAEKEARLIYMIGQANGLSREEIDEMLKDPQPIGDLSHLTPDQKFEHLYYIVQLMKIDGQVFKAEIEFCKDIADKLGYRTILAVFFFATRGNRRLFGNGRRRRHPC